MSLSCGRGRMKGGGGGALVLAHEADAGVPHEPQLARQWSHRWVPIGSVGALQPMCSICDAQS